MMRPLIIIAGLLLVLSGCSTTRASSLNDEKLCQNLGEYTLYKHSDGITITMNEIARRNINKKYCEDVANNLITKISPKYKLKLCQTLAEYHYKGAYQHFSRTLKKIEESGFADQECETMADFYYIRLARKKEKRRAIANAINQAAENMRRTNEQLYGHGSAQNPIHIKLQ